MKKLLLPLMVFMTGSLLAQTQQVTVVELHPAPHRVERSLKPRAGLVSGFHYVS